MVILEANRADDIASLEAFLLQNPTTVLHTDADGNTALHYSVVRGNLKAAELLLKHGIDSDATNANGISYHWCAPTCLCSGRCIPNLEFACLCHSNVRIPTNVLNTDKGTCDWSVLISSDTSSHGICCIALSFLQANLQWTLPLRCRTPPWYGVS